MADISCLPSPDAQLPQQCICIYDKVNVSNPKNVTKSLRKQEACIVLSPLLAWCFVAKCCQLYDT